MRVLLAFAYFFASVLVPVGIAFLGMTMAPARLTVDQEALRALHEDPKHGGGILRGASSRERFSYPGTLGGVSGHQDGGTIRVLLCEGERQARKVFKEYTARVGQAAGVHQSSGSGYHTYRVPQKQVAGRVELVDRVIVHAEGRDPDAIENLIRDSGVLRPNPQANWMTTLFGTGKYVPHAIVLILLYAAVQLRIWNRVGSWAARIPAKPGVEPVAEEELRRRLLALNQEDVPFRVVEKRGGKMEATWRLADAKWAGVLTLNKVTELRVIQLRPCAERKICRAVDIGKSVRATGDGLEMGFSLSGYFFRGIVFGQWEFERQYGFTFRDGTIRFEKVYEYKFSQEELRRPIVELVTASGWEYRPVLFISRILGG